MKRVVLHTITFIITLFIHLNRIECMECISASYDEVLQRPKDVLLLESLQILDQIRTNQDEISLCLRILKLQADLLENVWFESFGFDNPHSDEILNRTQILLTNFEALNADAPQHIQRFLTILEQLALNQFIHENQNTECFSLSKIKKLISFRLLVKEIDPEKKNVDALLKKIQTKAFKAGAKMVTLKDLYISSYSYKKRFISTYKILYSQSNNKKKHPPTIFGLDSLINNLETTEETLFNIYSLFHLSRVINIKNYFIAQYQEKIDAALLKQNGKQAAMLIKKRYRHLESFKNNNLMTDEKWSASVTLVVPKVLSFLKNFLFLHDHDKWQFYSYFLHEAASKGPDSNTLKEIEIFNKSPLSFYFEEISKVLKAKYNRQLADLYSIDIALFDSLIENAEEFEKYAAATFKAIGFIPQMTKVVLKKTDTEPSLPSGQAETDLLQLLLEEAKSNDSNQHPKRVKKRGREKNKKQNINNSSKTQMEALTNYIGEVTVSEEDSDIQELVESITSLEIHQNDIYCEHNTSSSSSSLEDFIADEVLCENNTFVCILDLKRPHQNKIFILKNSLSVFHKCSRNHLDNIEYRHHALEKMANTFDNNHAFSELVENYGAQGSVVIEQSSYADRGLYPECQFKITVTLPGRIASLTYPIKLIDKHGANGTFEFIILKKFLDEPGVCIHRWFKPLK